MVGGGGGLSFGSEVGCGGTCGVVSTDKPSSVEMNGLEVTDVVGSINVEDRVVSIGKPLFLQGWPLSEGLSFGSEVGCGGGAVLVGGGGGLSFGSEVGCGGVVSTDEPSSVGGNGVEVTDGVGSINVEDRVVSIGSAVGKHLDALLGSGGGAVMVGGGGGLSFGSEVGCGGTCGVVSTDKPSSVEMNGLEVTDVVGSINVEDRVVSIGKPLFLQGWPLSEGLSFGSEVGCGGGAVLVGGGGGLSFGSEVGCGGVVSTDEPSSVGGNGVEVTDGVGSINVEDRVVSIGSAVGKHLDALLLLHKITQA